MDTAEILRHILIVLVAAKVAAEVAERLGIPAVVGEIVAGILVGPSVLNAIGEGDEVLRTLGEIGVILLLLDVGLEMDLRELGKVGRTSLQVATVGVVAPMVLGLGRHVGDGRGLQHRAVRRRRAHRHERGHHRSGVRRPPRPGHPRGARRAGRGRRRRRDGPRRAHRGGAPRHRGVGVRPLGRRDRLGRRAVPRRSAASSASGSRRRSSAPSIACSRSAGTLVALALAFTLAFAELADMAKLAPIIGAFLAGLALNKAEQGDRVRRELTPIGHILIPVFFLQIGVDVDIAAFGRGEVLRDAAVLLVVAVVGKLLSPLGRDRRRRATSR